MQRCVAALLAVSLAGACTTHGGAKLGLLTGTGIAAVGVAMQAGAFGPGGETDPEDVAFIPLLLGTLILIPSLYVFVNTKDEDEAAKPPAPPPTDTLAKQREQKRAEAWAHTKQAAAAARAGDCPTVLDTARYVYKLDEEFYVTVFARDAAIERCIATPPASSSMEPD